MREEATHLFASATKAFNHVMHQLFIHNYISTEGFTFLFITSHWKSLGCWYICLLGKWAFGFWHRLSFWCPFNAEGEFESKIFGRSYQYFSTPTEQLYELFRPFGTTIPGSCCQSKLIASIDMSTLNTNPRRIPNRFPRGCSTERVPFQKDGKMIFLGQCDFLSIAITREKIH